MFNLFKRNKDQKPADAKLLREEAMRFIKTELQKLEGGEGRNVIRMEVYAAPLPEDKYLYEAALYLAEPGQLKQEIQRISDNFALDLPEDWELKLGLAEVLPEGSSMCRDLPLSLSLKIKTAETVPIEEVSLQTVSEALIRILSGKAEEEEYRLHAGDGRINIGREKDTRTADGALRTNQIAFPGDAAFDGNRFVSRQHAHIEWDGLRKGFMLFADEGGIPPGNKTKIKTEKGDDPMKLNSAEIGYLLQDGDQIILGESVVLLFNYH